MDDETAKELGLRALAAGFEWAGGAVDGRTRERYEDGDGAWVVSKWPDFRDPATLGVLLAQVREAWGCDWLTCQPLLTAGGVHGWRAVGTSAQSDHTEAHALVAALKAAKGVGDE